VGGGRVCKGCRKRWREGGVRDMRDEENRRCCKGGEGEREVGGGRGEAMEVEGRVGEGEVLEGR